MRLIADHARAMTFLIADGVVPSNEDRGYVLRRIIRRAIRFAYLLGVRSHITPVLAAHVIEVLGDVYPEIVVNRELITRILEREETQFTRTLETGLGILEAELSELPPGGVVPGETVFALHDTYGFPLEVTDEIAVDRGFAIDTEVFTALMTRQRTRSREGRRRTGVDDRQNDYQQLLAEHGPTGFIGREHYSGMATVLAVMPGENGDEVFLDRTPFYAEQGGQVGDTGVIVREDDGASFEVTDTVHAVPGLYAHKVKAPDAPLVPGDKVTATIDGARREAIRRNHTGTHLLHWALREVLGQHVKQQGSLVAPDRLRFDYSHFEPLTAEQMVQVEALVNQEVLSDGEVRHYETTQEEALAKGAIAFFGDKYGERVRVLEAGRHSMELCGGTHVSALGQIGLLKVVSESSIGSNLRRIEAVTGMGTLNLLYRTEQALGDVAAEAGVPVAQVVPGVRKKLTELKTLQADNRALTGQLDAARIRDLLGTARDGVVVAMTGTGEADSIRRLAISLRNQGNLRAAVLGAVTANGRPTVAVAVAPDSRLSAAEILGPIATAIGGGFGKQRDIAVAGGRDASKLDAALDEARAELLA